MAQYRVRFVAYESVFERALSLRPELALARSDGNPYPFKLHALETMLPGDLTRVRFTRNAQERWWLACPFCAAVRQLADAHQVTLAPVTLTVTIEPSIDERPISGCHFWVRDGQATLA